MRYESHRCIATYACGALLAAPQPAEHCDKEMRISEAIHADLLHGAAVLSRVIDKTLLELNNVLEGICLLLVHLFHGRLVLELLESTCVYASE